MSGAGTAGQARLAHRRLPVRRRWWEGARTGRWCRRPAIRHRRRRGLSPAAVPSADRRRTHGAAPRRSTGTRAGGAAGSRRGSQLRGAEGRRQLDPERVSARPEGLDGGQEITERAVGVGEVALMGHRLRQLEYEPEIRIGLPGPRPHRVQSRRRVEGCVALHRVAPARVSSQPLVRRQRRGQVTTLPGRIRPHRASDMEPHDCREYRAWQARRPPSRAGERLTPVTRSPRHPTTGA